MESASTTRQPASTQKINILSHAYTQRYRPRSPTNPSTGNPQNQGPATARNTPRRHRHAETTAKQRPSPNPTNPRRRKRPMNAAKCRAPCWGRWGGGKCLPGSKVGNPYPKLKTPGFGPLFLGETQGHMQKQTKIKMNNIDSLKLGGGVHTASKLWG